MKSTQLFEPVFIVSAPDQLKPNTLYVSMEYSSVLHKCCCGCGLEVVTPLSPTDWQLYFDGVSISLTPSIGNWNFPCQSHYFIRDNKVIWADKWTKEQIENGRLNDLLRKNAYYSTLPMPDGMGNSNVTNNTKKGFWYFILKLFQK